MTPFDKMAYQVVGLTSACLSFDGTTEWKLIFSWVWCDSLHSSERNILCRQGASRAPPEHSADQCGSEGVPMTNGSLCSRLAHLTQYQEHCHLGPHMAQLPPHWEHSGNGWTRELGRPLGGYEQPGRAPSLLSPVHPDMREMSSPLKAQVRREH